MSTPAPQAFSKRLAARIDPRAFTIVEALVLVAIGALLIGLLVPAAGAARQKSREIDCAARLQQLGIAISLYRAEFAGALPQRLEPEGGVARFTGRAFGGKPGTVESTADRPLNRFVAPSGIDGQSAEIATAAAFHSPVDRGGVLPQGGRVASTFEALGSSYVINDHELRVHPNAPWTATLIPSAGGAMPSVRAPERTWLVGSRPVLNFDGGFDRGMAWMSRARVNANLLMVDMHVSTGVVIPAGAVEPNAPYTFTP